MLSIGRLRGQDTGRPPFFLRRIGRNVRCPHERSEREGPAQLLPLPLIELEADPDENWNLGPHHLVGPTFRD